MKKILTLILVVCCTSMLVLSGCSIKKDQNDDKNKGSSSLTIDGENEGRYKIYINDEAYTFPCNLDRFLSSGYEFSESDKDRILVSDDWHVSVELLKDDRRVCNLYVIKDGDDIRNAKVLGAMIDEDSWGFSLAFEGLEIGKATLEDAIDTLGVPVNDYDETDVFTVLKYDIGEDANLSLTVVSGVVVAVYYWDELK